jgi:RHS repeat-associated protein
VDGLRSWQTVYRDASTPVVSSNRTVYSGSNRYVTNTAPDGSYTVSVSTNGRPISVTHKDSAGNQIAKTTYGYDTHGRQNTTTDARNGTTTVTFNNADLVTSVTMPNPGATGGSPQTTLTYYNRMQQATNVVQPDGAHVYTEYFLTGELKKTWGGRTYPVAYGYDYAGRMKTMTNWTSFPSAGARVTTWNYDAYRGWLTNKTYDGGAAGPIYSNTPAGRLATRKWARNITTTYGYNNNGALARIVYSDGTTPNVTNTFDRLGRAATTICNGMTTTFAYNDANELVSETFSGGTLNGLAVTNAYDAYLRRTAVGLNTQPSTLNTFGYDTASRLSGVTNGYYNVAYAYLANSPLVSTVTFRTNTATRMTTTKSYDFLNRLTSISSVGTSSTSSQFAYNYNSANQRTRATLNDGSYWLYEYDSLGQVSSGKKYWYDGTPVAGQQFEYAFDDIGNRTQTKAGGDEVGLSLRESLYSANNLNQYTNRDVPGYVDILGLSFATNSVTVNSQTAYRKGEYFRKELPVNNNSASLWTNIIVAATGQTSVTGNLFVAKSPELFGYDADGNMTNDGRWALSWDAENRLTKAESLSSGPTASKRKVVWEFDAKGRRIRQTTSDGSSGSYIVTEDLKFIADGWRHLAELDATNNALVRAYAWGLDLSESMDGAGGVGGLLMLNSVANGAHFYAYDGNGNVVALVKGTDGTTRANYEYDPFGQVLRATGATANENRFQFSTKRCDRTTDFELYEFRARRSDLAWLSRDPSSEKGGPNLYGFVLNRPVDRIDVLGLFSPEDHFELTLNSFNQVSGPLKQRVGLPCVQRIFDAILAANNLQDLLFLAIKKRHYNRDYIKGESDLDRSINRWNAVYAYQGYLSGEERKFREALRDWSLGPIHHKHDCKAALGALGRLSHSWQDFFAHGIHSSGWETGFFLTDSPDFVTDFFPSSYSMFEFGAEHPIAGEPSFSDVEYNMRKYVAEVYVRHQFGRHLRDWLSVCWCDCDLL